MKEKRTAGAITKRLNRRLHDLNGWMMRAEGWLAVSLLILLLVSMCAQVVARYAFRSPFSWSEELARFAMIWLTFIAASLVMARREHIAVDLWASDSRRLLPRRIRAAFDMLVDLVVVATCLLLLFGGFRFVWYVHPVGSPALGIPKSAWYGAVSTGLALMAMHCLLHLALVSLSCSVENADGKGNVP